MTGGRKNWYRYGEIIVYKQLDFLKIGAIEMTYR